MNPKVSIIIPVYNGENSISISLDSILSQTFKDYEVIIIDDGSNDKTNDIVSSYTNSDNRFRYFYQQNQGVSGARNNGIKKSNGDYICFLDSDDFYDSTFICKMYSKIFEKKSEACYCGYNIVELESSNKKKTSFSDKNVLEKYILNKLSIHTSGWMFKREYIIENNIYFPCSVSWGEDFEFFCNALAHTNNVTFVNEYLTYYRIGFEENRLSDFSMDKLDKDYDSIKRLINNNKINKNNKIENYLVEFRLKALLVYRLLLGKKYEIPNEVIIDYSKKYNDIIFSMSWNNGIRSLKLNYNIIKLKKIVKDIK